MTTTKIVGLSKPQGKIYSSTRQVNLFMAGVGSGKTFLGGIMSYMLIRNFPGIDGFIGANTHEQLNTSTFKGIQAAWEMCEWKEWNNDTGREERKPCQSGKTSY